MRRWEVACLALLLLLWSLINTVTINTFGRSYELFPMTAFQMFSGRPKRQAVHFVFEVAIEPNAEPIPLDARVVMATNPIQPAGETETRRILTAVMKSKRYGCPDYRLSNYRECDDAGATPWQLPRDMAQHWLERVMHQLDLQTPPYAITLMQIVEPLSDGDKPSGKPRRTHVLTWRPGAGYNAEDAL